MHHDGRHGTQVFDQIIPVADTIHTVDGRSVKSQQFCSIITIQWICRACQCAGAQRTIIHALVYIGQAQNITLKHFKISPHMMRKRDWLCLLQMGKARHDRLCVIFHNGKNGLKQMMEQILGMFYLTSGIKAHIQCHLIVSAASGMQFLARITDTVDQICLHKTMNILVFGCDGKFAVCHIFFDAFQSD